MFFMELWAYGKFSLKGATSIPIQCTVALTLSPVDNTHNDRKVDHMFPWSGDIY
jgi:hypothetical protein